jgi:hypothetical protein
VEPANRLFLICGEWKSTARKQADQSIESEPMLDREGAKASNGPIGTGGNDAKSAEVF